MATRNLLGALFRRTSDQPLRLLTSSISWGTTVNRSPTTPKSAISKMGGLGVLVDGHDRLGGLHAGPVLDRAGDPDRDVELRGHGLAGLADLELVRVTARVHRRPGRADSRAE